MEKYEDFTQEYYENKKRSGDYMTGVTLCQAVVCIVIFGVLFGLCSISDEIRESMLEGLRYLQSGDLTEEIQVVKDLIGGNAQI